MNKKIGPFNLALRAALFLSVAFLLLAIARMPFAFSWVETPGINNLMRIIGSPIYFFLPIIVEKLHPYIGGGVMIFAVFSPIFMFAVWFVAFYLLFSICNYLKIIFQKLFTKIDRQE